MVNTMYVASHVPPALSRHTPPYFHNRMQFDRPLLSPSNTGPYRVLEQLKSSKTLPSCSVWSDDAATVSMNHVQTPAFVDTLFDCQHRDPSTETTPHIGSVYQLHNRELKSCLSKPEESKRKRTAV